MDILSALLALRSSATCDHCDAKDTWFDDIRLHAMARPVSCPGDCHVPDCDGQADMTQLCTDCHRVLVRER